MSESQRSSAISKPALFACKTTPVLVSLVLATFNAPFVGSLALLGILTGVEIFVCKEYFGIGLVGLRWYFSQSEAPKFPHIVFYSRPLPYVASSLDSNAFWGILLFSVIAWTVVTFINMIWFAKKWIIIEIVFTIVNLLNLYAFLKCQSAGKEASNNVAKTLLLDTNESFQNVPKDSESDTTAEQSNTEEVSEDVV